MSLLEWRDDFRIGIAEVDHEHQELIRLINELHAALGADRSQERVEEFLGEIFARISAHFALEEKDMQARRYLEFAAHKTDHERLLDDIRDIMDEHSDHGVLDEQAFSNSLAAWFGDHFKTYDARLHGFLQTLR
ncbi:MAG TPA: bacteriohemerythrin [Steroidobacteraceae bacterium]